ncbi:MAG: hypothetical protein V4577_25845 [Bacteroidota bacterium]
MNTNTTLINTITDFLKEIGIGIEKEAIPETCFVPGIYLKNGKIIIDEPALKYPGDILHEAGHLAVMPPKVRCTMSDSLPATDLHKGGELMTLAWSYAASVHLGIDPCVVFHNDGYRGDSDYLLEHFTKNPKIGVNLLQWCEMAYDNSTARQLNKQAYPTMQRWMREK